MCSRARTAEVQHVVPFPVFPAAVAISQRALAARLTAQWLRGEVRSNGAPGVAVGRAKAAVAPRLLNLVVHVPQPDSAVVGVFSRDCPDLPVIEFAEPLSATSLKSITETIVQLVKNLGWKKSSEHVFNYGSPVGIRVAIEELPVSVSLFHRNAYNS
ncbi:hypothetical protein KL911_004450 [Ogataea haglerorum]|uniref:uncharacterized protein n=1 Tax=Ogataea haglerorum TaxID=1937702 RepID=UPI001C89C749|nr:uncharacterized protein KL911_004450 [Ogataea haglerorum]KAG7704038.1 hypothetical protein KL950_004365 [Ogataea haglerorum]KAG7736154.1 hypothetical protein KL923_004863 [Ogataea haglerorum]KAG7751872.1 hypothetical protein KL911_004450 [Ogataea haglerorum]KAG7780680.1 hypothetical protein KL922_001031 [Ogataea haglerorum]KAG7805479.1 hypothetical protein KL924_004896 [Ogataea haglerorum]